jgi:hypothetical protein
VSAPAAIRGIITGMPRDPAQITVRRYSSAAEADRHDLEYWMRIPERERILRVWTLSQELWRLRGELRDEPGLCRSVARLHRR